MSSDESLSFKYFSCVLKATQSKHPNNKEMQVVWERGEGGVDFLDFFLVTL